MMTDRLIELNVCASINDNNNTKDDDDDDKKRVKVARSSVNVSERVAGSRDMEMFLSEELLSERERERE